MQAMSEAQTLLASTLSTAAVKRPDQAAIALDNDVCEACDLGGELIACSFCNVAYHNNDACLGEDVVPEARAESASYEWPCPECFKAGKKTHSRKKLAPNRAANRKRRRGGVGRGSASS